MNRGSIFPYPQYNRTIVLGLSYRYNIFIRNTSYKTITNNRNNKISHICN